MYLNKQKTAKARFNPNSIKNFINVKTIFENTIHNLIDIDFTIFCLQISIQIGNVRKQGNNLYKQTNNNTYSNSLENFINMKTIFKNIFRN